MNAKQLIEAAKDVLGRQGGHYIHDVCNHILATVRPDDDEPVTRKSLEADGWSKQYIRYRHCDSNLAVFEKRLGFVAETSCKIELCTLKSIGHLRRLVAALGE